MRKLILLIGLLTFVTSCTDMTRTAITIQFEDGKVQAIFDNNNFTQLGDTLTVQKTQYRSYRYGDVEAISLYGKYVGQLPASTEINGKKNTYLKATRIK